MKGEGGTKECEEERGRKREGKWTCEVNKGRKDDFRDKERMRMIRKRESLAE